MGQLTSLEFSFVADLVRGRSGIALGPDKDYLVSSRLQTVVRHHGMRSVSALIAQLRDPQAEQLRTAVVEAMTTNETSWFRDVEPFRVFSKHVVPELVRSRPDRRLAVWSAACSTGQEPYTIAMSLLDDHPELSDWQVEVLATDLSEAVLVKARSGRYTQLEMNRGLPAASLVKHFHRVGMEWQVNPPLRSMVTFSRMNLGQPLPPIPQQDVVFLRNVLIYFDNGLKQKVLQRVYDVIRPGGYLFLGAAETTLGLGGSFSREAYGSVVVYRKQGSGSSGTRR